MIEFFRWELKYLLTKKINRAFNLEIIGMLFDEFHKFASMKEGEETKFCSSHIPSTPYFYMHAYVNQRSLWPTLTEKQTKNIW